MPRVEAIASWASLDPDGPPRVVWGRRSDAARIAVLLGAFDPPTNAHLELLAGAARADGSSPVLCLTKILLARPPDELFTRGDRVGILHDITERLDWGLVFANRGTYLDVGRLLAAGGFDATFVVGADKLVQLADPAFYDDGTDGVRATFDELRFVVVPRDGADTSAAHASPGARVLDASDVFGDDVTAAISGTDVRRSVRFGRDVSGLVPPEVALALRGYTSAR